MKPTTKNLKLYARDLRRGDRILTTSLKGREVSAIEGPDEFDLSRVHFKGFNVVSLNPSLVIAVERDHTDRDLLEDCRGFRSSSIYSVFQCDDEGHAPAELQADCDGPLTGRDDLAAMRLVGDLECLITDERDTRSELRNQAYAVECVMQLVMGPQYGMAANGAMRNNSPFHELMHCAVTRDWDGVSDVVHAFRGWGKTE